MEERLARLEDAVGQLIEVMRAVCEKQSAIDEEVDKLTSSGIYDRLDGIESEFGNMVGGLNDIIDGRRKREYTDGLREKHPEFSRYEDIGKRFGLDVYGIAADNTFDMPDEEKDGAIGSMLEELKGKFEDLIAAIEKSKSHEASETPEKEKAEEAAPGAVKIEVEASEDGVDPALKEMARKFRGQRVS